MSIERNPVEDYVPKGRKWEIMPLVTRDLTVVYWDLQRYTGDVKTSTTPE